MDVKLRLFLLQKLLDTLYAEIPELRRPPPEYLQANLLSSKFTTAFHQPLLLYMHVYNDSPRYVLPQ